MGEADCFCFRLCDFGAVGPRLVETSTIGPALVNNDPIIIHLRTNYRSLDTFVPLALFSARASRSIQF